MFQSVLRVRFVVRNPARTQNLVTQHQRILESIRGRDRGGVTAAMIAHLEFIEGEIRRFGNRTARPSTTRRWEHGYEELCVAQEGMLDSLRFARTLMLSTLSGIPAYAGAKPVVLKLAYVHVPENPSAISSQRFAKQVEERTQGRVKVEVYPGGQLGQQPEVFGGLTVGSIEMSNMSRVQRLELMSGYLAHPYL